MKTALAPRPTPNIERSDDDDNLFSIQQLDSISLTIARAASMGRATRSSNRSSTEASTAKEAPVKKKVVVKQPSPKKKAPPAAAATKVKESSSAAAASSGKMVVTIEACKQWGAFKTRANKIATAVGGKALVEINKEKPGKGNFVVRVQGVDEPIIELLGLKRPFPSLKALDMDDVCQQVLTALK